MAVPKRKKSRSNTRHRRAQWKASAADLVVVTTPDGRKLSVPRRFFEAYRRGLVN